MLDCNTIFKCFNYVFFLTLDPFQMLHLNINKTNLKFGPPLQFLQAIQLHGILYYFKIHKSLHSGRTNCLPSAFFACHQSKLNRHLQPPPAVHLVLINVRWPHSNNYKRKNSLIKLLLTNRR